MEIFWKMGLEQGFVGESFFVAGGSHSHPPHRTPKAPSPRAIPPRAIPPQGDPPPGRSPPALEPAPSLSGHSLPFRALPPFQGTPSLSGHSLPFRAPPGRPPIHAVAVRAAMAPGAGAALGRQSRHAGHDGNRVPAEAPNSTFPTAPLKNLSQKPSLVLSPEKSPPSTTL